MQEKIQKILSNNGLGSRRSIEKKINQRLVQINGKSIALGERFSSKDIKYVIINKKKFFLKKDKIRVLMYHKPVGQICTNKDTHGRNTVFDILPPLYGSKWISVGRLDINTSGLLLFTNYGKLAYRLMHPSYNIKREYLVRIFGKVSLKKIFILKNGVKINNSFSKFHEITDIDYSKQKQWCKVSLFQGKNREVRRLWNSVDIQVIRLIRISYGTLLLPEFLKPKKFLKLNFFDVKKVFKSVSLPITQFI